MVMLTKVQETNKMKLMKVLGVDVSQVYSARQGRIYQTGDKGETRTFYDTNVKTNQPTSRHHQLNLQQFISKVTQMFRAEKGYILYSIPTARQKILSQSQNPSNAFKCLLTKLIPQSSKHS